MVRLRPSSTQPHTDHSIEGAVRRPGAQLESVRISNPGRDRFLKRWLANMLLAKGDDV